MVKHTGAKAAKEAEAAQETTVAKQNAGTEAGAAAVGFPADSTAAPQIIPQVGPDGEAGTPEPTPDDAAVGANSEVAPVEPSAVEIAPPVAPKRHRRPPPASDDWKKGYGVFGGG